MAGLTATGTAAGPGKKRGGGRLLALRVVVTAAGSSRRMGGGNKLLLPLHGKPVLVHTLGLFHRMPEVEEIVVSAPPGQEATYADLFREHGLDGVRKVVPGGAERQHSIHEALLALRADPGDVVAVHDGARPLVTPELVRSLLAGLEGWDGAIPGVPVKDTIKRVDAEGAVLETLTRAELVAVQTPQVFRLDRLLQAYALAEQDGHLGTDDASLVEWAGGRVRVVEGDYRNLKITTAEDLVLAQGLWDELYPSN